MPFINSTTVSSSGSRTAGASDISNPEDRDAWFDAIDHVEMDETWFDACDSHHADPVFAGETADSRVPFTTDCRRGVQQLIRTLGKYEESRLFSVCLSKMLPGTPGSLVMAAGSLYSAITEHRNIDSAVLHALGLASWCLPDNINIVSRLATFIRDTVTGWTDETFLQTFLGSEENHTSTCLFTALAVTAIVAGRRMKDEGTPQRGLLKVPVFVANIFIRASHYRHALENMTRSAPPSGRETREKTESFRRAPAFEVDTSVEMTGEVCDAAVSCFPSEPRITSFSSNSTATSEAYTRAMVQNRPASAPGENDRLSVPEQIHSLAVEKFRQKSELSDLQYCATRKTETRRQANEKVITNTYFNTKCDATVYPESLRKFAENTDIPETQVSSVATSLSGEVPDSPLLATSGNSAFVSGRGLFPSASGNTVHTITGGNIFSTMLSPLVNALYETGKLISRHDPFRFPEANALPIKEKQNDNMRKDTRKARHGQRKLRRNPVRKENHRVITLFRSKSLLPKGKIRKEKLLYAVSTYLFYGKNGIAGHENKVKILAGRILSASGLYGGKRNEPLSTEQAKFTVRRWVFDNILGMAPDKYVESKMKRDAYPNYFTIGSVQYLLPVDKLPAGSRIHSDSMTLFENTMLLTMWKSFLTEEMPFLNINEESVKTMQLSSYDFANLYSGSRFLKTVSDKAFTAGEAMATGGIMWDLAVHEGVTEDKLAYHLAPALFFAASVSSGNTRQNQVNDLDAINRYLRYRKETNDVKKDIEQKHDNYLSATKKWLSKGALADDIISQCPDLLPGLVDLADAIRTPTKRREKAEKFAKENYLNGFLKPCDNVPVSLDDEYKKRTSDVADSFREIDKYLILSAIGGLPEEERIFISSPSAIMHPANVSMRTNRVPLFAYGYAHDTDINVSLDCTDLVSVRLGEQERIYALKAIQGGREGYRPIRVDRDIRKYIDSGILNHNFHGKYEVDGSVVKSAGDRFRYSIFVEGNKTSDNSNNIDYLVNFLSKKHRDTLYHTLYQLGNDQSGLQKTWSVIKHIIPFYDCVEGTINNDPVQAVPSCLMDAVALIPVFGQAASLGTKFGMGLARGLRSGAVIVGKGGIKSAGKSLLREISLPTTAELASLGKGTLRAIDPGFELIAGISRKFGNKMVTLMSGNKKTAELAQEIASSRVLDRLPRVPADAKVMGILPETRLQVPVKVIGKQRGRDIYVRVNPETGVAGGTKYFCSKNGNLKLFSSVPGKHSLLKKTSNRVKRGADNPNLCSGPGTSLGTSSFHKEIRKQESKKKLERTPDQQMSDNKRRAGISALSGEFDNLKLEQSNVLNNVAPSNDVLKVQQRNENTAIENHAINNVVTFIEVEMSEMKTVEDPISALTTSGLTDCSALAVLSNWNGEIYETRTLMHLAGSSLKFGLKNGIDADELISDLKDELVNGGKVIWVGGVNSQTNLALEMAISQDNRNNEQPILDLFNTNGVSVEIAGSKGVTVHPDGRVELMDGPGRGFLTAQEQQVLLSRIAGANDIR